MDTCFPFGRKSAPGICHWLIQAAKGMKIRWGYHLIVVYLNDFLIIGSSKGENQAAYDCLAALLLDLGFQLSGT